MTSADERRDSPRIPLTLWIRNADAADAEWEEHSGNIALGGVSWSAESPFEGKRVEVHFRVPGTDQELWVTGEILRSVRAEKGIDFHARFDELELKDELALARFLQNSADPT